MSIERLTILADRDDLACVQSPSSTLLAFDVDLHIHLLDRNVPHLTPWDIVSHDELSELRCFEHEVWQFWTTHAHACFEGLDLLHILPYRHLMCFGRLTWVAYVVARAFEKLNPREVVTFDEPIGHGLDQPPGHNRMPLLAALVRGMAEQAGIPTRILSRQAQKISTNFIDWTARQGRRNLDPVSPERFLNGRDYVLFPASGPDLVRQLPLIRQIQRETDLAVVQLYKAADEDTLRQIQTNGHFVWHESQVSSHVAPVEDQSFARKSRQAFDHARHGLCSRLRAIFDNPYADIHFDFIFGEYVRKLAWHVRAWRSFLCEHRPNVVVANYPNPILEVASHSGIPCLAMSHGLMLIGNTQWFKSFPKCTIGAISPKHRNKLVTAGIPVERISITGDPHFDALTKATDEGKHLSHERQLDLKQELGIATDQRLILLVTGGLGTPAKTDGLPKYDWAEAVRCFEQIGQLAAHRPQWRFAVKCHPRYDHPSLYERVNRALPDNRRIGIFHNDALKTLAPIADVIVACNVITSALIEASLYDRPVMQLRRSLCWYDQRDWGLDRWLHLESVDELESELETIFSAPLAYRQRVRQTRIALEDFYGDRRASGCQSSVVSQVALFRKTGILA